MDRLNLDFESPTLLAIDGHAVIHRAFHALPPLTNRRGEAVGAVYGFLRVLFKLIREYGPTHLVVAFDAPGPTFRHQAFPEYKATRAKAPDELYQQIPWIKQALSSLKVPVLEVSGFEADDLIGTLVALYPDPEKLVVTGDSDLLQLVGQKTRVILLGRGVNQHTIMGPEEVSARYQGLSPDQLVELKGLQGDNSDNLPGVPGVGEKIGRELILRFGRLEQIYGNLTELSPSLREKLENNKKQALLSREMGRIRRDAPIAGPLEKYQQKGYNRKQAEELLEHLGLKSLIKDLP